MTTPFSDINLNNVRKDVRTNSSNISFNEAVLSSLNNDAVKKTGTQTITGAKTFTGDAFFSPVGAEFKVTRADTVQADFVKGTSGSMGIGFTQTDDNAADRRLIMFHSGGYFFFRQWNSNSTAAVMIAASQFYTSSDDRLKHNETDISNALTIVEQLKPQYYDKGEENKPDEWKKDAGFIAQEVLETDMSFCVMKDDDDPDEMMSVNYDMFHAIWCQSIKELHDKNKQLEARLTALENN